MRRVKDSGQAVGAQVLTNLTGFAPPNVMSQASRLVARQRWFNLVVTNVPGPQIPLYLIGREMSEMFPMVPLVERQAVGVAIMSYNGRIDFGLVGDYDVMSDIDQLAKDFRSSLAELAEVAGVTLSAPEGERARARNGGCSRRYQLPTVTSTTIANSAAEENQAMLACPFGITISAARIGPIAEPTLPPTWNSDCARPCRPPEASRATREASGWNTAEPAPTIVAATSNGPYPSAAASNTSPIRVTPMPTASE